MSKNVFSNDVRTAIVTGAASGIGARAVERLRSEGVRVVAGDLDQAKLDSLYGLDAGVMSVAGDVTDEAYATRLLSSAVDRFGSVDRLVHSAGVMPGGEIADMSVERFRQTMSINYLGTVQITKGILPYLRERGRGQIVVLGSLTGYLPSKGFAAYSASKAAVDSYVEILAEEERPHGIQVLLAAPNAVKTPLLAQATGGPKLLEKLVTAEKSPLMITTDNVLDAIDKGLAEGKRVVVPGGRALYALRRLSPSLMWSISARVAG